MAATLRLQRGGPHAWSVRMSPRAHSGTIYAEQRISNGVNQWCSREHWLFTGDTYRQNYAAVEGGVLAWNFNDVQTFSPCPYVVAWPHAARPDALSNSVLGFVCLIASSGSAATARHPLVSWTYVGACCGHAHPVAPLWCACLVVLPYLCAESSQDNEAGSARDDISSPLIAEIYVSSGQWQHDSKRQTEVPPNDSNSSVTEVGGEAQFVQVAGECSRTVETFRFPIIDVRG